jgi:hypothetical protein
MNVWIPLKRMIIEAGLFDQQIKKYSTYDIIMNKAFLDVSFTEALKTTVKYPQEGAGI